MESIVTNAAPAPAQADAQPSDSSYESPLEQLGVSDHDDAEPAQKEAPRKQVGGLMHESPKEKAARQKLERAKLAEFETEVVVDGKTMTIPVKELADSYQIRQMSQRKASEADRKIKELEQRIQKWKQNPDEFFDDPKSRDEWAQKRVERMIQEMEMTPEQRELEELRQFRAKQEQERQRQEQERQRNEAMSRQQSITKYVAEGITTALKDSWLPNDSDTIEDALKISYQAAVNGQKLTFPQIVSILEERALNRQKKLLTSTKVDKLAELFPEHIESVRKYTVERSRQSPTTQQPRQDGSVQTVPARERNQKPKYMNEAEFNAWFKQQKARLRD